MVRTTMNLYREIPIGALNPSPDGLRERIDPRRIDALSENISAVGMIHPLTVRYCGDGEYEIVSGLRRFLAGKRLGFSAFPCFVTDADEGNSALLALSENVQRKNLNFFEEAEGMQSVMRLLRLTQDGLAKKLGKSQSAVANKLRLLQLSEELRSRILDAKLSERHARALLSVDGDVLRKKVLNTVIFRGYTVAQTEEYIRKISAEPTEKRKPSGTIRGFCGDLRLYLNSIDRTVDLMKRSGFDTRCETSRDGAKIIYRIEISRGSVTAK